MEIISLEKTLLALLLLVPIFRRAKSFKREPSCFPGKSVTAHLCTFQIALGFFFTVAHGDGKAMVGSVFKRAKHMSMFALSHVRSRGTQA